MAYPIKGFLETSFSDWPGKVVSVIFLPFCNFRCPYCHNYELVLHPEKFPDFPLEFIMETLFLNRDWIDGVCVSGGEPTLHPWLPSLLRSFKETSGLALKIKLDTNGSSPELLERLIQEKLVDYVAMDLKAPLEMERYEEIIGIPLGEKGLTSIQKSIKILLAGRVDYEFRTTFVPGYLREEDIYQLAQAIKGARRYTLQNFNPRHTLDKKLQKQKPFPENTLKKMQKIAAVIIGDNDGGRLI